MLIDNNYINACAEKIASSIKSSNINGETIEDQINILKNRGFNLEALECCINKFVKAEIDFETLGNRGLGRMTDYVPRLGGVFRKEISSMSSSDRERLHNLIQEYIMILYLGMSLLTCIDSFNLKTNANDLYAKWVPLIYVFPLDRLGEALTYFFNSISSSSLNQLIMFLNENNLTDNEDKLREIISGYAAAGVSLRQAELTFE